MKKVIVITGPTAVGKTNISIEIAKILNTVIINADASQFRKNLDIGTAKIKPDEMEGIRHYFIDFLNISDDYSIKNYQADARLLIDNLNSKGIIPIIVGGSGLYINSLIGDYQFVDETNNDSTSYDNLSNEDLYEQLKYYDIESASKIHPNNRRRVIRAINLAKENAKLSLNKSGNKLFYESKIICLMAPRDILYTRINQRCELMFQNGWVRECEDLKKKGIDLDCIKEIGYKELNKYLEGCMTLDDTISLIRQKTRNYAKRQMTWFKNKMDCEFVEIDYENQSSTVNKIIEIINSFII